MWLCRDSSGNEFALKQIAKKSNNTNAMIARREIDILNCLNNKSDSANTKMITLFDHIEDNNDLWLIFEKGGRSVSNLIFKIKGEFLNNERIYLIKKGDFLKHLFLDINNLKSFLTQMLNFIHFLNTHGIVHCDLKPDNILIDYEYDNKDYENILINTEGDSNNIPSGKNSNKQFNFNLQDNNTNTDNTTNNNKLIIKNLKIIDFGSAFFLSNPDNFSSNTPEYMSPEITDLIEKNVSSKEITSFLKNLKQYPWCIDMWSLGVTILEMALSCPLWMSYKAKVVIYGKVIYKTGLFGVKGRSGSKIYSKQIEVSNNVHKLMQDCLVKNEKDKQLLSDLLSQMLDLNYKTRISPLNALNHEFFS